MCWMIKQEAPECKKPKEQLRAYSEQAASKSNRHGLGPRGSHGAYCKRCRKGAVANFKQIWDDLEPEGAEVGTQTAEGEDRKERYAGVWEVFDVPVMQVTEEIVDMEEIVDFGQIFSHELVEQIVDLAVPRIMEKIVQVIQLVPRQRIKDQIVEQIVAVLVPQASCG